MNLVGLLFLAILYCPLALHAEDLGNLSANPFGFDSTANQFGAGSPFAPNGINNPFSPYGSPFSNQSATNPFATDAPRLYDQQGTYRGKLSANPFDADSTSISLAATARRSRRIPSTISLAPAAPSRPIRPTIPTATDGGLKGGKWSWPAYR